MPSLNGHSKRNGNGRTTVIGRPKGTYEKKTPEAEATIILAVEFGVPLSIAPLAASITVATFYAWMNDDPSFAVRVKNAEAKAISKNLGTVQRAAEGGYVFEVETVIKADGTETIKEKRTAPQWQAAAWILERRWYQLFGKRDIVTLQVGEVMEETKRLAEEAGIDPELALLEAKRLVEESSLCCRS